MKSPRLVGPQLHPDVVNAPRTGAPHLRQTFRLRDVSTAPAWKTQHPADDAVRVRRYPACRGSSFGVLSSPAGLSGGVLHTSNRLESFRRPSSKESKALTKQARSFFSFESKDGANRPMD